MDTKYLPVAHHRQPAEEAETPSVIKGLSQREREVLEGLCQGKSNKEIARDLDLREPTIKLHVQTLSRKLGAKNRVQAVITAQDLGFVPKGA